MRRAAYLLPLVAMAASSSAQSPMQPARTAYQPAANSNISWAIGEWRRLRQSSGYTFGE